MLLKGLAKEARNLVVVVPRDRIELVVVAVGAAERQSQKHFCRGLHTVVAVCVGIANEVQPVPHPPLAVPRSTQQAVDNSFVGVG